MVRGLMEEIINGHCLTDCCACIERLWCQYLPTSMLVSRAPLMFLTPKFYVCIARLLCLYRATSMRVSLARHFSIGYCCSRSSCHLLSWWHMPSTRITWRAHSAASLNGWTRYDAHKSVIFAAHVLISYDWCCCGLWSLIVACYSRLVATRRCLLSRLIAARRCLLSQNDRHLKAQHECCLLWEQLVLSLAKWPGNMCLLVDSSQPARRCHL